MRTLAPAQGNLTRESLTRGAGRSAEARARLGSLARSDEELDDCLRATLAAKPVDAHLTETKVSSESVFDGKLLRVRRDTVRLPDRLLIRVIASEKRAANIANKMPGGAIDSEIESD